MERGGGNQLLAVGMINREMSMVMGIVEYEDVGMVIGMKVEEVVSWYETGCR